MQVHLFRATGRVFGFAQLDTDDDAQSRCLCGYTCKNPVADRPAVSESNSGTLAPHGAVS
jgi:hypothetical protein